MATIEDFNRLNILTGKIIQVDLFPEARKPAYKLSIDFGQENGIKQSSAQLVEGYKPEELKGKTVLAVVNFPPRQIANYISEVLVLGVPDKNGETVLVVPEKEVTPGRKLY